MTQLRVRHKSFSDEEHITPFCQTDPAVQSAWSPSSLELFQQCPRKYYYTKLERWQSRKFKDALWFGSQYHAAVEHHYVQRQLGHSHDEALASTVRLLLTNTAGYRSDDTARTRTTLLRAVVWYLDQQQHVPFHPLRLQSGHAALELEWELQLPVISPDGEPYILRGHFDEVSTYKSSGASTSAGEPFVSDQFLIPERKTTKTTLGPGYWYQFKPNNQTAAYSLAGSIVLSKAAVAIVVEACQTMVGGARFGQHLVTYSEAELEEFVADTVEWIKRAEDYAARGYWPMNRASCDAKGGCAFRDVCARAPSVRHVVLESEFTKLPSVWECDGFARLLSHLTYKE